MKLSKIFTVEAVLRRLYALRVSMPEAFKDVLDFRVAQFEDWVGETGVHVWVIIRDDTDLRTIGRKIRGPIDEALLAMTEDTVPTVVVSFVTKSDVDRFGDPLETRR